MKEITYRLAVPGDNDQLISLTAASSMAGETALRIDRNPNFFKLLDLRGTTKVFLALDGQKIVGCLCATLQYVYVGGLQLPLQYIGDFKVHHAYRNQGIGLRLCDEMAGYVISIGADLAFLNVSSGNTKPLSFFRNRPNVPDFENIGVFHSYQFVGTRKSPALNGYRIEPTNASIELIDFLNQHQSKYALGAVVTAKNLAGTEMLVIRESGQIIAAMCLADTMAVKQNVVTRLSAKMRALLTVINILRPVTGMSRVPSTNTPVQMIYIKYLCIPNGDKKLARMLLNTARNMVYQKGYSFISIGLHEKDPLKACFSGLFKLTFNSVGMLLSIKDDRALIAKVKGGIPFEDFSLV